MEVVFNTKEIRKFIDLAYMVDMYSFIRDKEIAVTREILDLDDVVIKAEIDDKDNVEIDKVKICYLIDNLVYMVYKIIKSNIDNIDEGIVDLRKEDIDIIKEMVILLKRYKEDGNLTYDGLEGEYPNQVANRILPSIDGLIEVVEKRIDDLEFERPELHSVYGIGAFQWMPGAYAEIYGNGNE